MRKKFLEPEGIRQEESEWPYVGTWVAANLKITDPTPETHPDFPLWQLGYTPEQVHELFWPFGFHFCNTSDRPSVSGRFGPAGSGFWRHEYSVEPSDNLDNIEDHFWTLFRSWMVIPGSKIDRKLGKSTVEFPRDCVQVIRCRPFTFATKIVNRWYSRQTMLIGDAAHVFPPFGGQGIATGIRDAQGLAWRLALMSKLNVSPTIRERILSGWAQERRHAWRAATRATKLNGSIVNQRSVIKGLLYRVWMRILWCFPAIAYARTHAAFKDKLVFDRESCPDGFFLQEAGGGQKIAQIWVQKIGEQPRLSDTAFIRNLSSLSLMVLVRDPREQGSLEKEVKQLLKIADLPDDLLTMEDVTFYHVHSRNLEVSSETNGHIYYPCTTEELAEQGITPINGYRHTAVEERLGDSAKFVLARPDFFVHSVASDVNGMANNLQKVRAYLV